MIIEIVSTALVTSLAWYPVVRSKARKLVIARDSRIAAEYARDTAQALLASEKVENTALCETNAMLRARCGRLARDNEVLKAFKAKRNMSAKQRARAAASQAKPYVASATSLGVAA